ncbi:MAG: hypothetical protein B7Z08_06145 [Sphingomonadales bacterium 32-68-7]|nr:MAG: hypothetical protein B7Z33_10210 [Sphingomonadales bacterium 12-68-11]OYX09223.1 MAG: hypothetical protein B7Z08_06145 [Sphingomonadales bacterium 32-68-7]
MRKRNFFKQLLGATSALTLLALPGLAAAQDRPTDPSTVDILDVLVEKGVLTRQDADGVLSEARRRAETREAVVRVPYVPEAVREQIRDEIRQEVIETAKAEGWAQPGSPRPSWLDRLTFSGDVRVRGEGLLYQGTNTPLVIDTNAVNEDGEYSELEVLPFRNTIDNRVRGRVRARFGVDVAINDYVSAGVRFATGDLRDSTSTNATLTRSFGRYQAGFDRAYVKLTPFAGESMFRGTGLVLGKFDNPFLSTEAIFDRDLQFEGAAATLAVNFGADAGAPRAFVTGGAFPLEEYEFTASDKYLFAGQVGGSAEIVPGFRFAAAGAIYHYQGLQGEYNTPGLRDNDFTAPSRVQFGNSLFNLRRDATVVNSVLFGLASEFSVASVYARAEFDVSAALVGSLEFEGARNLAFDAADLTARAVPGSSGDTLFHGRARIGHRDMDARGGWSFAAGYRSIEADATPDLFTDSDFGLGGTDQDGFVISGSWTPLDRMTLTGSWYSARTIDLLGADGTPALPIDTDTVQLDLGVKF